MGKILQTDSSLLSEQLKTANEITSVNFLFDPLHQHKHHKIFMQLANKITHFTKITDQATLEMFLQRLIERVANEVSFHNMQYILIVMIKINANTFRKKFELLIKELNITIFIIEENNG